MAHRKTIREQIIETVFITLSDMKNEREEDLWNFKLRDNLDNIVETALPAFGIEEGEEAQIQLLYPCVEKILDVMIHFQFRNLSGEDAYEKYNDYLGLLQEAILGDRTVNNLAFNLTEVGNNPQILDRTDPRPGGMLMIEIMYRHREADPYTSH